jgi:hypothetical protein
MTLETVVVVVVMMIVVVIIIIIIIVPTDGQGIYPLVSSTKFSIVLTRQTPSLVPVLSQMQSSAHLPHSTYLKTHYNILPSAPRPSVLHFLFKLTGFF